GRYRNLRQNPAVTVMLADGWKRQAILEGNADFLDMKSETARRVLEAQKRKYGWVTDALAEFRPAKAFTWKTKEHTGHSEKKIAQNKPGSAIWEGGPTRRVSHAWRPPHGNYGIQPISPFCAITRSSSPKP